MSLASAHPGFGPGRRTPRTAAAPVEPAAVDGHRPTADLSAVAGPTTTVAGLLTVRYLRLRTVAAFTSMLLLGTALLGIASAVAAWHVAARRGIIEEAESLMVELGFETFQLRGDVLLDVLFVVAATAVILGTVLAVVGAMIFNLVSWMTGGIAITTKERRDPQACGPPGR